MQSISLTTIISHPCTNSALHIVPQLNHPSRLCKAKVDPPSITVHISTYHVPHNMWILFRALDDIMYYVAIISHGEMITRDQWNAQQFV